MGETAARDGVIEKPVHLGSATLRAGALVGQRGRILGPRALGTRQKRLDATRDRLDSHSLREIRVIDVARAVDASPATFYQYFKDIEEAVLALAEAASSEMPVVAKLLEPPWLGHAGLGCARKRVPSSNAWGPTNAISPRGCRTKTADRNFSAYSLSQRHGRISSVTMQTMMFLLGLDG